jgi:hypothetical protein
LADEHPVTPGRISTTLFFLGVSVREKSELNYNDSAYSYRLKRILDAHTLYIHAGISLPRQLSARLPRLMIVEGFSLNKVDHIANK